MERSDRAPLRCLFDGIFDTTINENLLSVRELSLVLQPCLSALSV